jgi:zinc/manganese transport system substrate-binding protein
MRFLPLASSCRFPILFWLLLSVGILWIAPTCAEGQTSKLKVATLHPVLTEMGKSIGGDLVTVVPLIAPGTDVHAFSPTPKDIKALSTCQLILASGKNLENYLGDMKDNLTPQQSLIEVGREVPSLKINPKDATFACCPAHAAGALDPHWWNSVPNMQRAARYIGEQYSKADPTNAVHYKTNAKAYEKQLGALHTWCKKEISKIPADRRVIATSHLSLSYFAKEYGFKLIPVQGLSTQTKANIGDVAQALKSLKDLQVPVIFAEAGGNAKQISELAKEVGVKVGSALVMDANGTGALSTYDAAVRHNVNALVQYLAP